MPEPIGDFPTRVTTSLELEEDRKRVEAFKRRSQLESKQTTSEALGLAIENQSIFSATKRLLTRSGVPSGFDPNYKGNPELEEGLKGEFFNDEISDIKKEATSDLHFKQLIGYAREDKERHKKLSQYGLKGLALEMGAAVADPVGWGLGIFTGGFGAGLKMGRLAQALTTAGTVAAEAAVIESYLTMSDTERDVTDILYAAGGSAILGGTLGFLIRTRQPALAKQLDETDSLIRNEVLKIVDESPTPLSKASQQQLADLSAQGKQLEQSLVDSLNIIERSAESRGSVSKLLSEIGISKIEINDFLSGKTDLPDFEALAGSRLIQQRSKSLRREIKGIQNRIENVSIKPSELKSFGRGLRGRKKQSAILDKVNSNKQIRKEIGKELLSRQDELNKLTLKKTSRLADKKGLIRDAARVLDSRELQDIADSIFLRQAQLKSLNKDIANVAKTSKTLDEIPVIRVVDSEDLKEVLDTAEVTKKPKPGVEEKSELKIEKEPDDFTINFEIGKDGNVTKVKPTSLKAKKGRRETLEKLPEGEDIISETGPFSVTPDMAKTMSRLLEFIKTQPARVTKDSLKALNLAGGLVSDTIKRGAQAAFTYIDQSDFPIMRALNFLINESPQGNFLPQRTASILSYEYTHKIRSAVRGRYSNAFYAWSKSQGRGVGFAGWDKGRWRSDFDTQVFLKVHNPDLEVDKFVTEAADGMRDGFSEALNLAKEKGALGFKYIEDTKTYTPKILSTSGMMQALHQSGNDHRPLISTLSLAYQRGGHKLPVEVADKVAAVQVNRTLSNALSNKDAMRQVLPSQAEINQLVADLDAAGVSKDVISTFVEDQRLSDLLDNVSNRAKKSLLLNPSVEFNGIRMTDMLNTNMSELSDGYFREMGGTTAMAEVGFPSMSEALNVIDAAQAVTLKSGAAEAEAKTASQMLRDAVTMIYGKSIDDNPGSASNQSLRFARDVTSLTRLGQVGFAQLSESARSIGTLGFGTMLESVQGLSIFRRDAGRKGGISTGELDLVDMREIEEYLGRIGEDDYLTPLNSRHNDYGESVATEGTHENSFYRTVDNALAVGSRVNSVMSGFRSIQGGLEKITMRGIKNTLIKMADGDIGFLNKALTQNTMQEVGWDKAFQDQLFDFINKNPKSEKWRGRDVRLMNFQEMPIDLRQNLITGMHRLSGRLIQKNFVGDSAIWINKSLGKAISQFRTFGLVSYEKQLIHDLRGDKIQAAQMLGWGMFVSAMTYAAQTHMNAVGQEDPKEFLDDRMSLRNWSFGAFNKLPQTAGVSILGDVLGQFGALPEELMQGTGRLGFSANRENIPILGLLRDGKSVVNAWMDVGKDSATDTYQDGTLNRAVQKTFSMTPLMNVIGVGQMQKAAVNALK